MARTRRGVPCQESRLIDAATATATEGFVDHDVRREVGSRIRDKMAAGTERTAETGPIRKPNAEGDTYADPRLDPKRALQQAGLWEVCCLMDFRLQASAGLQVRSSQ